MTFKRACDYMIIVYVYYCLFLALIGALNIIDSYESDSSFDNGILEELVDDLNKVLMCAREEHIDKIREELRRLFRNNFSEISCIRNKNTQNKIYKIYDEINSLSLDEIKSKIGGIKNDIEFDKRK